MHQSLMVTACHHLFSRGRARGMICAVLLVYCLLMNRASKDGRDHSETLSLEDTVLRYVDQVDAKRRQLHPQ